jgi:hypothetical protein
MPRPDGPHKRGTTAKIGMAPRAAIRILAFIVSGREPKPRGTSA